VAHPNALDHCLISNIVFLALGAYLVTVALTTRQSAVASCLNETFQSSRQQSLPPSWSPSKLPLPQFETKLHVTTTLPSVLRMFSIAAAICCTESRRDVEACAKVLRAFVDEHPEATRYVSDGAIKALAVAEVEKKSGVAAAQQVEATLKVNNHGEHRTRSETSVWSAKDEYTDDTPVGATALGPQSSNPQIVRATVGKLDTMGDEQDLIRTSLNEIGVLTISVVLTINLSGLSCIALDQLGIHRRPFLALMLPLVEQMTSAVCRRAFILSDLQSQSGIVAVDDQLAWLHSYAAER